MDNYSEQFLRSHDGLQLYYRDYSGSAEQIPILCLHGLTRNSRDFAELAPQLARHRRVVVPDMRGRGRSDYDSQWQRYNPSQYIDDVLQLLDTLNLERTIIVGTSMGGLIGMGLAAIQPQRIAGLVLNDVGPVVEADGVARIQHYLGNQTSYPSWEDATERVKQLNSAALPDLNPQQWLQFAKRCCREEEGGKIVADYDPNIAKPFSNPEAQTPPDLWPLYQSLPFPILALRGDHSDILSATTLTLMQERHALTSTVNVVNRGHAPQLDEPEALAAIERFLLRDL